MRGTHVGLAVAACFFVAMSSAMAEPPSIVYSDISIPRAVLANEQGINARGDIVGFYRDGDGKTHGFVLRRGEVATIDHPGAGDVSPRGEIVGVYRDASNRLHGFLRDADVYLTLDFPDATSTQAFGINAGGDVVGAFIDAKGQTRAFVARRTRGIRTASP